jgi:hypothetical protein
VPGLAGAEDPRSPDAREPMVTTPAPLTGSEPAGFQWADAGIGAAGGIGIALAVAGIGVLTVQQRRRGEAH